MQVHMNDNEYNPFFITLADWIVRRNRVDMAVDGGPKMREARHEGKLEGRKEMMCEVIAHEINRRRIEAFKHWKQVPILNSIDSRKELVLIETAYESSMELIDENKVNGSKVLSWDVFFTKVENILNVSAITPEMMAHETERHRQAVVEGYEEPNESDIAWLTEEEGKASDEVRRLRKLTMKAEKKQTPA